MTRDAKALLEAALRLPPEARADLASELIESLDERPDDANAAAAWAEEVKRRLAEFDAGAVKAIPVSIALRRVRAAAGVRGRAR